MKHYCIAIIIFPHLSEVWILFSNQVQAEEEKHTRTCTVCVRLTIGFEHTAPFPRRELQKAGNCKDVFMMMIRSSAAHRNENNCFLLSWIAELNRLTEAASDMIFLIDDFVSAGWRTSITPKSKPSWRLLIWVLQFLLWPLDWIKMSQSSNSSNSF